MNLHRKIMAAAFFFFLTAGCTGSSTEPVQQVVVSETVVKTVSVSPPVQTVTVLFTTTPTPENPANLILSADHLAVVLVSEEDVLQIQSSPGSNYQVIKSLPPHADNLEHTGRLQEFDGQTWVEIKSSPTAKGWVNNFNLTSQVSSEEFCADLKVNELIEKFVVAVKNRDAAKLAGLISPTHGLIIKHEWWNPQVVLAPPALVDVFTSISSYEWGVADGSGLPIQGTFAEIILPKLDHAFGQYRLNCNSLEPGLAAGGTTGYIKWPYEFTNFNYVSLYRPAPPGDELNWRTWAVGIEYLGGEPYIVVLVQYHWEI